MRVITPISKFATTIPTYNSGGAHLFKINQTEGHFPEEYLEDCHKKVAFRLLSVTDRLRYEFEARQLNISLKINIPQILELTSLHVLKINESYHKIYNAYHYTDRYGFPQTDLTLIHYDNPKVEEV